MNFKKPLIALTVFAVSIGALASGCAAFNIPVSGEQYVRVCSQLDEDLRAPDSKCSGIKDTDAVNMKGGYGWYYLTDRKDAGETAIIPAVGQPLIQDSSDTIKLLKTYPGKEFQVSVGIDPNGGEFSEVFNSGSIVGGSEDSAS